MQVRLRLEPEAEKEPTETEMLPALQAIRLERTQMIKALIFIALAILDDLIRPNCSPETE